MKAEIQVNKCLEKIIMQCNRILTEANIINTRLITIISMYVNSAIKIVSFAIKCQECHVQC